MSKLNDSRLAGTETKLVTARGWGLGAGRRNSEWRLRSGLGDAACGSGNAVDTAERLCAVPDGSPSHGRDPLTNECCAPKTHIEKNTYTEQRKGGRKTGRSTQRAPSHTRPPAGSPARVPSTPCPARPMSLARALPRGPGQLSTVPGSPPALTPGTRPAPGWRHAPRAPCRDPRDGAGGRGLESPWGARPLGSEAAGRLVEGTSGQRINEGALGLAGLLTRPTEPPPQGRAPLPAPGGGSSPQRGVWPPRRRSASYPHASASVCLSVPPRSLCLSIPLSPLTVPWGKAGVMSGPSSPAGAPGDAGCRRLLSRHPWLMEGSGNSGSGRGKTWHPEPRPPPPWGCCAATPRRPQRRSACLAGPGLPGNDKGDAVISSETSHPAALS